MALKSAGAVILGKTVTTEFADNYPALTRNPHNPAHTPGGSSSGSAAAVADFMAPAALGTQTGGSVIRPAAYCGVAALKPSFASINRAGLKMVAESLDTIGVFAREVEDLALSLEALSGRAWLDFAAFDGKPRVARAARRAGRSPMPRRRRTWRPRRSASRRPGRRCAATTCFRKASSFSTATG